MIILGIEKKGVVLYNKKKTYIASLIACSITCHGSCIIVFTERCEKSLATSDCSQFVSLLADSNGTLVELTVICLSSDVGRRGLLEFRIIHVGVRPR